MFNFMNLKFGTKILLLGIGSVLVTILAVVAAVIWQSGQFSALAQDQFAQVAETDLSHIAEGVYNMVKAQDEAVQQQVNSSLHVAELVIHNAGQVKLADEKVDWTAFNESTQRPLTVQLPKMYVGDTWLGQNTRQYATTPIVDHVQLLVGGTATIFQRMNEQGDMLRVATNVLLANGERAIGTYIPAVGADGSPDPVISAILRGSVYRGSTFVVNAWYNAAFEPIRDESGRVVGMLYVGIKQESVESIREAILRTRVGQSGYVYVLGGTGADQGRYIISQRGFRDGENIWWARDGEGNLIIQSIVNQALTLKPGETATERYQWQDIGDPTPRWKITRITYYEPWHWVIAATIDESEIQASRLILENGQARMIAAAGTIGLAIALVAGFLSVLLARSIARPVTRLANIATQVAAGDLGVTATVESKDEIGTLAATFNSMTAQLRDLIDSLETRVEVRTAQLQASADVGRAASSILNSDQLIHQIVNSIGERFNFYYVAAFTVDESGRWATLRDATGQAGQQLLEQGHALAIGGRSMVGSAIRQRQPRIALDVGAEAVRFANPLLPDTRSEIALPLIAGDQVLGALDVQSTQPTAFDENSATVLQGMADQIAVALNNADQYQREQAHLAQAHRLLQAAIELSEQTDRAALQDRLLVSALALLKADSVQYWTRDEDRIKLTAVRSAHPATDRGLLISQELAAQVFQSGLISRLDTAPTQADYTSRMTDIPFQAALITPVSWQGKVIGVLNIMRTQPGQLFTQGDENSAQLLAAQVAAAFQNITLAEQRQHTLDELNNLNRRLTGQAWDKYLQASGQISAEWREGAWLKDESRSAKQKDAMSIVPYQAANLQLPIKVRGQTIGEFSVMTAGTPHTWSEEDLTFAQSLVDQAGQMIENARLLEETERFAHREQRIREITTRIRAADDIQGVLEATAVELARSMGVPRAIVRLTTADSVRQEIQAAEPIDH